MAKFTRCTLLLAVLTPLLVLGGCASIMVRSDTMPQPDRTKAVVTIFRPSVFMGDGANYSVWDGDRLLGVQNAGTQIQYQTEPGEHLFLVRAENWSAVKADLAPGKQYFLVGRIYPGVFRARVVLTPANLADMATIEEWKRKLTPIALDPQKGEAYAKPRLDHVREAIANYGAPDAKFITLTAEDGVSM